MILSLVFPLALLCSTPYSEPKLMLQVNATGIAKQTGYLMVELRNDKGKVVQQKKQDLKKEGSKITFAKLPKGAYAVAMFHDVNANGELDTNLVGIPKEPYGFSNNVRGTLGPPDLKDQLVELRQSKTITIDLK